MTTRHRRHSTARKREVVEAYFNGESMRGLSQKYVSGVPASPFAGGSDGRG